MSSSEPYAVAVQGGSLYWSEGISGDLGKVKRCSLGATPCVATTITPGPVGRIFDIAVDSTNLYVSNGGAGEIDKCPLASFGTCVSLVDSQLLSYGLALDSSNIYWTTALGMVAACPIGGCSNRPIPLAVDEFNPHYPVPNGIDVFFATGDGALKAIPATPALAAAPEQILFQLRGSSPWSVAVDTEAVYWTDTASTAALGLPGPALRRLAK
jgi:hypothetical protein